MKLRIAFYTDSYLPAVDGVVNSLLNFKKGLEKKGHKVYIFGSAKPSNIKKYSKNDVFLYPGIDFKPYPQYSMAIFPYNSMLKLRFLDIDMIHAHTQFFMGSAALISSKFGRYPIVGSYHTFINNGTVVNTYYPKNARFKKFARKYLQHYVTFFHKKCDATTVPSDVVGGMLLKLDIENVYVVPNSVDIDVFNTKKNGNNVRKRLGITDKEKMVLYVGRLSREKKLETLLRAAKTMCTKNERIKVVIAGSGPAEHYYKQMAKRLNIIKSVKFLGMVDRAILPNVYAASDVFCLPSTFETQGIVSLEAMASGKPVVCADYLALKELVQNGYNGEKFIPGNYRDCAKKIEKVINDTGRYNKNAVNTAYNFSIEKVTEKLLNVYDITLQDRAIY